MQNETRARQVVEAGATRAVRVQMCIVAAIPLAFAVFAAAQDPTVAQKSAYWGFVGIGVLAEIAANLWITGFRMTVYDDGFAYRRLFGRIRKFQFSEIRRAYFAYEQLKGTKYARFYVQPATGEAVRVNVMVFPRPVVGRLMAELESRGIKIEGANFLHARAIMSQARKYYPAGKDGVGKDV